MHGEEIKFVKEAYDTNWMSTVGENINEVERLTREKIGCQQAVALSCGTAALHLATKLAGVKRGDKVFCSDMTFAASVNPIMYEGGEPIFIDTEYDTWNMSPEALEKAFEKYPQAKVVMLVHLYGTPAKTDEIMAICEKHGAVLIEDAAEALAAEYRGRKCGTLAHYGIVSFNGNKIITTSGGGMLLTRTKEARDKAFFWSTQAREPAPWYQHEEIGYNYRMSNVVAGIGRGQLMHLDEHRDAKEVIYRRYEKGLAGLPISLNPYPADCKPNFWLSCMLIDKGAGVDPMTVMEKLAAENIEARPIWKPMHMQPVFAGHDFVTAGGEAVNEDIFARGLCLPSDIKMTELWTGKKLDMDSLQTLTVQPHCFALIAIK